MLIMGDNLVQNLARDKLNLRGPSLELQILQGK